MTDGVAIKYKVVFKKESLKRFRLECASLFPLAEKKSLRGENRFGFCPRVMFNTNEL